MRREKINRREFVKGSAVATGAAILAACAPQSMPAESSTGTDSALTKEAQTQSKSKGKTMNALIVYDTLYGNTGQIAEAMKEAIGKKHQVKIIKAAEAKPADLGGVALLLVGSPTHGGQPTEAVKAFLAAIPTNGLDRMQVAAFDTSMTKENESGFVKFIINFFGFASSRISKTLTGKGAQVVGAETFLVVDKEGPLVEGEVERAKGWAEGLIA